jgi:hypothetical protein
VDHGVFRVLVSLDAGPFGGIVRGSKQLTVRR